MEIKEEKNYYDAAMCQINEDSLCLSTYQYLKKNEEWAGRYEDFLKGKKSLPLLYDPFFKKIFNPTERISCYSADLVLRQYKMITGKNQVGKHEPSMNGSSKPSYKDMRKVHTIILFEDSNKSLISDMDKALYFHVGKTKFNTGIKIELLQDFVLVSLDTFRKYRYSDIKEGRTEITDYDYDSSQYNNALVSEKMKRDRLKFLSLFVAETPQEIDKLVETFPDLESVRHDINEYLERPGEVLSMFSEALRILDRNTAELMVDRMKDEIVDLREQNDELKASSDKKDAEIARLKKLLEEQNK